MGDTQSARAQLVGDLVRDRRLAAAVDAFEDDEHGEVLRRGVGRLELFELDDAAHGRGQLVELCLEGGASQKRRRLHDEAELAADELVCSPMIEQPVRVMALR